MTDNLIGITARYEEIMEQVRNGTLDEARVEQMLEVILDGSALNMPDWWRTPQQQLKRAHQLWPDLTLPEPPKRFTPATVSEVLLLHVPGTVESLWDKITAPKGYTKRRMDISKNPLDLAYGRWEYTEPVWLGFDPKHGLGVSPESLWGQNDLAASEVLSALIQFPNWCTQWHREGSPAPHMSGYVLENNGYLFVPTLFRWDERKRLGMGDHWAVKESDYHSSPSIRELPN